MHRRNTAAALQTSVVVKNVQRKLGGWEMQRSFSTSFFHSSEFASVLIRSTELTLEEACTDFWTTASVDWCIVLWRWSLTLITKRTTTIFMHFQAEEQLRGPLHLQWDDLSSRLKMVIRIFMQYHNLWRHFFALVKIQFEAAIFIIYSVCQSTLSQASAKTCRNNRDSH